MFCLHLSSFQSSPTGSEVSVGVLFREEGGDGGCTFGEVEALSGEIPLPSGNTVLVSVSHVLTWIPFPMPILFESTFEQ